jgi:hypothetical protein
MLGSGPVVPLILLLVGVLYLLFTAGFTSMSSFSGNEVGFYWYICVGVRPKPGVAGAAITLATDATLEVGLCGLFGFFAHDIVTSRGRPSIPWWAYPVGLLAVVYACGRRSIEFSGIRPTLAE